MAGVEWEGSGRMWVVKLVCASNGRAVWRGVILWIIWWITQLGWVVQYYGRGVGGGDGCDGGDGIVVVV